PIRVVSAPGPGEYIAREIESLAGGLSHLGTAKSEAEYGLSDIAVIVRTQHQARPVMDALARASIPYDTAYARPLASVNGVTQRLALLEQKDWQALVMGIGERSLRKIGHVSEVSPEIERKVHDAHLVISSQKGTVMERLAVLEDAGLFKLPRLDDDHAFYQYARMFGGDAEGFIRYLRLTHDQGVLQSERVHIITAHAAKGLEFRCVFIAGLSLGSFPLAGEDPAEEENLFYVGMTRAIDILYLVGPPGSLSPFVMRIPQECCAVHKEVKKARSEQLVLFE
ncbi:ATP-dependent helicase, partial [bacterium]|nr:ATP-dependent helicase [bacterium]